MSTHKEGGTMKKFFGKKRTLALAVVAVLAVAGAAIAYWSTTGSGSGSGSVAGSNGTLVLHGSITDALTPGGSSSVTFTADNAGTSSLQVGTVHLASVSTDKPGCVVDDFTMPDVVENQTIAAGASGAALSSNGTLSMADTAVSQDACKGAALTLSLTSN
jgi:hypothetical protein